MKKIITLLLISSNLYCFAQNDESLNKGFDPTNFFTGGSVALNIGGGNHLFLAGINPHFGYTFAKWIDGGVAVNFQYFTERDQYDNKFRSTTYGAGLFTRIYPVRFLFIQAQPEYNLIKQKSISASQSFNEHITVPSVLIGAGYTPSRSDKNTFSYFSILFDVLKNINSPYIDGYGKIIPVVRAGFNLGLNRNRNHKLQH